MEKRLAKVLALTWLWKGPGGGGGQGRAHEERYLKPGGI